MEDVVERVLTIMRRRLGEQLTLDDLAESVSFSKFYFARMFRSATGISPRRFLYAMRVQEAKRMLVSTSLGIADISNWVGYRSVGTFTSRFTASVGVSPTEYRRLRGQVTSVLDAAPVDPDASGMIRGEVEDPEGTAAGRRTVVGLFRGPVPEGRPVRYDTLITPGGWSLPNVPEGQWYVFGIVIPPGDGGFAPAPSATAGAVRLAQAGPILVSPGASAAEVTLKLRPMRPTDPPILAGLDGPPAACCPAVATASIAHRARASQAGPDRVRWTT